MDFLQISVNKYKIYLLISFRFVIVFLCFFTTFFLEQNNQSFFYSAKSSIFLLLLLFNILFLIATPAIQNYSYFAIFQIAVDLVMETLIIYVTGGILSIFICLYFVSILIAGLLISLKASILCASFAIVGISGIVTLYYITILNDTMLPFLKVVPPIAFPQEQDLNFCRAYLFAQSISFYMVAFLSGRLADARKKENIIHKEILDNLVDGILVINSKHSLCYINLEAKKILHLSVSKKYDGMFIINLLNPNIHMDLIKAILMNRTIEYQITWEYAIEKIPLLVTINQIKIKNKTKLLLVILKNISYQKRMEEAIDIANRLSAVNETASMIAHEIRNPLASISGACQELDKNAFDQKNKVLIDILLRESRRIDKITEDFLEFSKLRKPKLQKTNISKIIKDTVVFLGQRNDIGIIHCEVEDDLFVRADSGHLSQVFYNLGINALESRKEVNIELIVSAKKITFRDFCLPTGKDAYYQPDQWGVQLQFIDNGKGIRPEDQDKVFHPFFTTKSGGSGIGLSIVQQILEAHQAHYYITSIYGEGTNFYIFFPEWL